MEQKAFVSLILASMLAATLHADQSQNDSPTSDEPSTPSLESTSKDAPSTPTMLNPVSAFAKKNAKLDSLNRNTYTLDKSQITDKGYNQSTNIFQYMPFVGLNDTGLGSNIDLRSQGARANTSVQVLINGVPSNMLDSSHGVTPISTLSPNTIESIEILPGGGAVMYGNGTRGGVVSITTQKRYEKPFFSAGASYGNIIASTGNNINADAKFGTKLRSGTRSPIYVSLGAAYIHQGGPRQGDLTQGAQANGSFVIDFGDRASLDFSLDYFGGSIKTSPNNSFQITPNPSKNDRDKAGYGSLHNTQHRVDASLGLVAHLTENSTLDVRSFFHLNRIDYVDSTTNLALYMNAFKDVSADQNGSFFDDKKAGVIVKYDLHHAKGRFIVDSTTNLALYMNAFKDVSADQNGSFFDDKKAGVIVKYDLHHAKGRFIAGLESIYNRGERAFKDVSADQNGSFFDDKKAGVIVKYDLHHAKGRFIAGLESIYNRGERAMNGLTTILMLHTTPVSI